MATAYNPTVDQGADWYLELAYKNADGTPINLTGYTAQLQAREFYGSATAALTLTVGSGITLGGSAGTISIHATATQTGAMPTGVYVYDLELYNGAIVTRIIQGKMTLSPQATR